MPATEQRTRPTRGESHARSYQRRTRVPRDHTATCPTGCGYTVGPTTQALAARGLALHSCDRHRKLAARRQRGLERMARVDRTPKPCPHGDRHQHGTYVCYTLDHCRCRPCVDAAVGYERTRTRRTAYGTWQPYVDAEPARRHVRALMAQGMGLKRITAAARISAGTMVKLLYGVDGRPPSKRIRPANADRILAVQLDLADAALVDAAPTWRLIHGLIALGYPKGWIGQQLGARHPVLQLDEHRILKRHADAVRALADRYGATPGPSQRARRYAAEQGWTPDLLWQDDDPTPVTVLDHSDDVDEVAVSRYLDGDTTVRLTRAEKFAAYAELTRRGTPNNEIARRLHLSGHTLATYRQRLTALNNNHREATA